MRTSVHAPAGVSAPAVSAAALPQAVSPNTGIDKIVPASSTAFRSSQPLINVLSIFRNILCDADRFSVFVTTSACDRFLPRFIASPPRPAPPSVPPERPSSLSRIALPFRTRLPFSKSSVHVLPSAIVKINVSPASAARRSVFSPTFICSSAFGRQRSFLRL